MCNCIHCRREQEAMEVEFLKGYKTAKADTHYLSEHPEGSIADCVCPPKKSGVFRYGYERGFADSSRELAMYESKKQAEESAEAFRQREEEKKKEWEEKIRLLQNSQD